MSYHELVSTATVIQHLMHLILYYCYAALNALNPVLVVSYDRSHVVLYSVYALFVSKGRNVLMCPVEHLACIASLNSCGGLQLEGIVFISIRSGLSVCPWRRSADQGVACEQGVLLEHAAP